MNRNIGCIEIIYFSLRRPNWARMNRNIGCIEIRIAGFTIEWSIGMNRNIGCIEIGHGVMLLTMGMADEP